MLIFAAIVAIFVYGMTAALLGTILPDLSDRFHLTPSQNGTIAFARAPRGFVALCSYCFCSASVEELSSPARTRWSATSAKRIGLRR